VFNVYSRIADCFQTLAVINNESYIREAKIKHTMIPF